jgi:uncharacterized protein with NAD-binding domain and iron-sulfur cluster
MSLLRIKGLGDVIDRYESKLTKSVLEYEQNIEYNLLSSRQEYINKFGKERGSVMWIKSISPNPQKMILSELLTYCYKEKEKK